MNAQTLFDKYIFSQTHEIKDMTHEEEYQKVEAKDLKRTQFKDLDTFLYSSLIEEALKTNPDVRTIIDLGAGSSIPTLMAIRNTNRIDVSIIAVDIDSEAHWIGSQNALSLGLEGNFTFHQGPMDEALQKFGPYGPETLIVSNPPFIAAPENLSIKHYVPVNGGYFGDEYLLKILEYPFASGVNLALLWGSLTSPKKLLPLIGEKYDLVSTKIYKVHFGDYTKEEPIRSHLYRLREAGDVYFEESHQGREIQYVFGTLLRARQSQVSDT